METQRNGLYAFRKANFKRYLEQYSVTPLKSSSGVVKKRGPSNIPGFLLLGDPVEEPLTVENGDGSDSTISSESRTSVNQHDGSFRTLESNRSSVSWGSSTFDLLLQSSSSYVSHRQSVCIRVTRRKL